MEGAGRGAESRYQFSVRMLGVEAQMHLQNTRSTFQSRQSWSDVARQLLRAIAICLMCVSAVIAQDNTASRLTGKVFIVDSQGRAYISDARVIVSGPVSREQQSDVDGHFEFVAIPAGQYTIDVEFAGLAATRTITAEAGKAVEIELELKPAEVKSSVTVSEDAPQVQTSAPTQTISSVTVQNAPNQNDRTESVLPLIPGVVRGPDGRINMKGARNTQSGALVNSANATDPASGSPGLDVPIDVVASVQVISNPYDAQYGKLTGAVSTVETKTSNYEKLHFSIQNILPRTRVRNGDVIGLESATPRIMFTGPLMKDRVAFTQSLEYRFIRTPVNSLPATQRDTKLEAVNSYTQFDLNLSQRQTATVSVSIYPQKLQYMGLNTFTPQPSTSDYHQRGYQFYGQHRYITGGGGLLTSQVSYKTFDVDITAHSRDPYRLLVETTEGGFFNQQARRASRFDLEEKYQFAPRQLWGSHLLKVGLDYARSTYDGRQAFRPVEIASASGAAIERIDFTSEKSTNVDQHETAWYVTDQWNPISRLTVDLGLRFDSDTLTTSVHTAPRAGFQLALTKDGKTILKGGGGIFYDRVPLMIAGFSSLPNRTVSYLDAAGQVTSSTQYVNRFAGEIENPRSTAWNVALSRELMHGLIVEGGYENRVTSHDFVVSPVTGVQSTLDVSNHGGQSYREFHLLGRYHIGQQVINASYVRSRAYGNLNDFFQYFGNVTKAVVPADDKGRLAFDAPNRVLLWGDFKAPWKLNLLPVYDIHTGFPYSVQNEYREYVGPRNTRRYPRFASFDLQALRPFSLPLGSKHIRAKAGFAVFNLFNHFNPREVQSIAESYRFGHFYNNAWREFRGKLIFEF